MIVDALVAFQQPIFVYIPPFAELRGGAWVVVDPTIHAEARALYSCLSCVCVVCAGMACGTPDTNPHNPPR